MYRIRKVFKFEAAHRLLSAHSTECLALHGHSYVVEVFLASPHLNKAGMVMDFGRLKDFMIPAINRFDHSCILHDDDGLDQGNEIHMKQNPTAENMAHHFFTYLENELEIGVHGDTSWMVEKVRVHETATGWAEYERDG